MNNLPLQPLKWDGDMLDTPLHTYQYLKDHDSKGKYMVKYAGKNRSLNEPARGFATIDEAKAWAWNHYNEKMQPYVKPDSITDIANWFKAAKPEPTDRGICTQIGCHFEEFAENIEAINGDAVDIHSAANDLKNAGVKETPDDIAMFVDLIHPLELLDALCDQIVTATGVAYMMGFDIEGALKEVIRSNNSKMVDGKFEFDDNGKIIKPDSYSEPDLTPFISTMQNLHKGE